MNLPNPERHLQAVVDLLSTINYPDLTVEAVERTQPAPTIVCHLIPGGWQDGSLGSPYDHIGYPIQTTVVAQAWQIAGFLWARVQEAMLSGGYTVDGRHLLHVTPHGGERQIKPDHTVSPTVFTAKPIWLVQTVPA